MGSEMCIRDSIKDCDQLVLKLHVNGELRQEGTTADWVRSIPELLADITEFMTLNEGDVLITGTPDGRVDVKIGDQVVVEVSGLGSLTNTIVAE